MFAQLADFISKAFTMKAKAKWVDKGVYYDDHVEAQLMAALDAEADEWLEANKDRFETEDRIQAEYAALSDEEQMRVWNDLCDAAMTGQVEYQYFYLIWKKGFRELNPVH